MGGTRERQPRRRSRDVLGLAATGVALVVVAACGAFLLAAMSEARRATQAHADLVRAEAMRQQAGEVAEDVRTFGLWSRAFDYLATGPDRGWLQANFEATFRNRHRHDLSLLLDGAGRPVLAERQGRPLSGPELAAALKDLSPLVAAVRADAAARAARAPDAVGPKRQGRAVGAVRVGGQVMMAAAATMTPEAGDAPRIAPQAAPIVVSAMIVDREFFAEVADAFRQRNLALSDDIRPGPGRTLLLGPDGRAVASVTSDGPRLVEAPMERLRTWAEAVSLTAMGLLFLLVLLLRRQAARAKARQRRAEAGEQAKAEFIANISHEIRTPLNGVLGMAQIMAAGDLSAVQRERLAVIQDSGGALLEILNDILDLSRLDAGRLKLALREFDAEDLVRKVASTFSGMAAAKDLEMRVEVDAAARGLWLGDDLRLRQMLGNLVSNAVKFTSDGAVTLGLQRTPDGLMFVVRDTGIGMEPERIPEMFEKFAQADPTSTRKYGGAGLGLSITRSLLQLMGGRVSVESQPGQGSCFVLSLPLARATRQVHDIATPVVHLPAKAPERTPRILAAEDNLTNQFVLKAILETLDVTLVVVGDGAQAVEAHRAEPFDAILMDVQMPVMNGVEATLAIRALEAELGRPRTPVIAMTANVLSHQLESYRLAGMDAHLAKPLDVGALCSVLDRALSGGLEPEAAAA